jgi:hypothetical protein
MMNKAGETQIVYKVLMYNYIKTQYRIMINTGKDSIRMSLLELRYENINCMGLNDGSVL